MLILHAAVVVLAQAAAPQPPPAAAAAEVATAKPAAPAKPEKPTLICHDETEAGRVISRRVCRTREQINADERQSRREQDALSDPLAACNGQLSC